MAHGSVQLTMKNPRIPANYTIADVPAGRARVVAWHEELGSANKTVEVPASGDIAVNFTSADFKKSTK